MNDEWFYMENRIAELEQALGIAKMKNDRLAMGILTDKDTDEIKQQVRDEFESAAIDAWKKENASLKEQLRNMRGYLESRGIPGSSVSHWHNYRLINGLDEQGK